ncbi:hypothetical protein C2S53_002992 [Perilla frutescens var. hirtella]|uniref:DUF7026 domain-containing protein n=1 Tax=Perilla frutescens var. hirtella TaxID=608512 RepID=A0AAD4JFZ0_PERFH|nr:hypothetical protein C2S53_002992 [Perilla frutescens var. hirtella]
MPMTLLTISTPQIAPIQTLPPNFLPIKSQSHSLRFTAGIPRRNLRISCTSKDTNNAQSDELLAAELGLEIKKLNSEIARREDAFNKSRELLFAEVSDFVGFKSEDFKSKWRRMNDDEKWVLVRGFVAEWSAHFHPLSARSVKELVEEYVGPTDHFSQSVSANLLSDFTKFFGFHRDHTQS